MRYNTSTGFDSPNGHEPPHATSGDSWQDPGIDTAAEARRAQEQLQRYADELASPATAPHRKEIVSKLKANLERALPYQVAQWQEIDRQRARTAAMAQGGLNRLAGSR